MGHGRHVTGSSYEAPTPAPPVADYHVATNPELNPDCSCNYFAAGIHTGRPYYLRQDGLYRLSWNSYFGGWCISIDFEAMNDCWIRTSEEILGLYYPENNATGIATVSAGPH